MTETAPFWSLAELVVENAEPERFQVSLEDIVSDVGQLTDGDLSWYAARGTPFRKGDILFGKLRPYLAKYWLADRSGTAGGDIHVYRPASDVEPRFLRYIVGSRDFIKYAEAASKGVKMPRVEWMGLREFFVYRPNLAIQQSIADYLDRETGEIDAMIAKMDQLAETLGARRIEVIREWVRTGDSTDADGPVHPVLGRIATGWRVAPIQTAATMKTGHTPSRQKSEYWVDTSIPWFTLADVWQLRQGRKYVEETKQTISELGLNNSSAELLPVGTVLLSRTASVGFTGITRIPLATSQDFWNWVCGPELLPEYLWYQFVGLHEYFVSLTLGSTHRTIYAETAGGMRIVLPPLDEQQRIVDHLDEVTSRIDQMLAKVAELKSLLAERRAALITEVVTGRKEVA